MYVYCPRRSADAFELVKALGAHRLRQFDGIDFWDKRKRYVLKDGDVVVCWGATVPEIDGVRVLNGLEQPQDVFDVWTKLVNAGVPTLTITRGKHGPRTLTPRLFREIQQKDATYVSPQEPIKTEYRIHSFNKRSIRAGVKVPREGFTICNENDWKPDANLAHPWVRSYYGGWRVNYDGFKSTPEMRKLAHKAVASVGLTFAAVDIGQRPDGRLVVLEVDSAPRIEGGTVLSYMRAINRWVKEGVNDAGRVPEAARVEAVPDIDPGDYYDDPDPDTEDL